MIQYLYPFALVNDDAIFFFDNVMDLSALEFANFLKLIIGFLYSLSLSFFMFLRISISGELLSCLLGFEQLVIKTKKMNSLDDFHFNII